MNLDPASAEPGSNPSPAPRDWTLEFEIDGGFGRIGVVKRSGIVMCRILCAGEFADEMVARTEIAWRARKWIEEFLRRPEF